jgi:hypothetical protein
MRPFDNGHISTLGFNDDLAPDFEGVTMFVNGWVIDTVDCLGALSASDMPDLHREGLQGRCPAIQLLSRLVKREGVPEYFVMGYEAGRTGDPDQIWSTFVGGTGTRGKKAPPSFKCLLSSFPGTMPPLPSQLFSSQPRS